MLGRLARYMRMLGCDVTYPHPCPDSRLIAMARAEGRVLLTRDHGISCSGGARAGSPIVVELRSHHIRSQLKQLIREGWITGIGKPRCSLCNAALDDMDPAEARHLLPPYTLATQNAPLYCASCNILFWEGSHWDSFRDSIARITRASPLR